MAQTMNKASVASAIRISHSSSFFLPQLPSSNVKILVAFCFALFVVLLSS